MVAFSAGALLGAAFFDLLPEAAGKGFRPALPLFIIIGILFFFCHRKIPALASPPYRQERRAYFHILEYNRRQRA